MKKTISALIFISACVTHQVQSAEALCSEPEGLMTLKIATAIKGHSVTIEYTPATTVAALKSIIHNQESIPVDQQKLVKPISWLESIKWFGFAKAVVL